MNTKMNALRLIEKEGFYLYNNGGGCMVHCADIGEGYYVLLSDIDGEKITDNSEHVTVGLYNHEGTALLFRDADTLEELQKTLKTVKKLPITSP